MKVMGKRQPPLVRRDQRAPLRLTNRDRRILETIHAFDGMLSLEQIDRLFFSGRGGTWPRERMRQLFDHDYVGMLGTANAHRVPQGETIYFLNKAGAALVAGLRGEDLSQFAWREEPRWAMITHDLAVNRFRIDVMEATDLAPTLCLHRWIPESVFWVEPDRVQYQTRSGVRGARQMRPDGFFTLRRPAPGYRGQVEELAFLLEIDMGTEDNPRFAREKVRPGVAYTGSAVYAARFGVNYGRWLVVTTSRRRLENMKAQTERAGGAGLFYFTTFEEVNSHTILTAAIWHLAGRDGPVSILPNLQSGNRPLTWGDEAGRGRQVSA